MFIYLSKKIAIPNNTKLKCVGWNKEHGYIACGGDDGLLKVLKLESGKDGKVKGLAAPSNLSMNQTLEGHNGQIQVVCWNEAHQKLTSSDQYGLIIVWMLYKGSWYEEMINNRNKSVVKGMGWNTEGQRICIVYEDGAVIVGSVDGNRIWGKEIKNVTLTGVCWAPDSRLLLFSLSSGEVHVYDNQGGFVSKVSIQCLTNSSAVAKVIGLTWYNGKHGLAEEDQPTLVICYDCGRLQIMRDENDENPALVDTGMTTVACQWNHDGTILAVAGQMFVPGAAEKDSNVVQFYNPHGEHLRTLKVPGKQITSCAWEGGSLRIALAVDSFIYFANIRPDYRWTYFAQTVVYTHNKPDRQDTAVTFWNTKSGEKYVKHVKSLLAVASQGEHCVLATRNEDNINPYGLILCNNLGTPVDSKYINIEPAFVAMTSSHVFAASRESCFVWHFRTAKSWTHLTLDAEKSGRRDRREKLFHIDDNPSGQEAAASAERMVEKTNDPICCITASEKTLLIARESGSLQRYALPSVALVNRYNISSRPHQLALNCNTTMLSVIDVTGLLQFLDLDGSRGGSEGDLLKFERKDVWDMEWAQDNPDLFAMMEKTRMYIFRNMEPEEPILSSGYICSFNDLEIKAVLLDEVLLEPESPSTELLLELEVKSLRDTRDLLDKVGIKDAQAFIEENPHQRLWRLLAEAAVEALDLTTAETAYVRCKDYPGIQFVKRLANVTNANIQRAEVAAWFGQYDEAEKLYLEVDRRDLAIGLRRKLGDWFKVLQLLKGGGGGTDGEVEEAWNYIGDYYAERHKWEEAVAYYEKARNEGKLVKCYYVLEDYDRLEGMVDSLQPGDTLLPKIGSMFSSVGMGQQAVEAYVKSGHITEAIDTCVTLNRWHEAVELAKKHNQPTQISSLLGKYAQHLLDEGKTFQAIELYRKANHFLEGAKLLFNLAKSETEKRGSPLRIKKLYVLGALLVEEHQAAVRQSTVGAAGSRSSALMGLMEMETSGMGDTTSNSSIVDSAWRGAEAFHFLMLCQRQLYEGYVDAAMKTALHLREYEELLNQEDIYCLLALSSCANRAFGTCAKAFIKLDAIEQLSAEEREEYQELGMDIFVKYSPKDSRFNRAECTNCETMIPDWCGTCPSCSTKFPTCIVTGRPLMDLTSSWACSTCHHRAAEQDVAMRRTCPFCHTAINLN